MRHWGVDGYKSKTKKGLSPIFSSLGTRGQWTHVLAGTYIRSVRTPSLLVPYHSASLNIKTQQNKKTGIDHLGTAESPQRLH